MDSHFTQLWLAIVICLLACIGSQITNAAPVDQKAPSHGGGENEIDENVIEIQDDKKVDTEIDDLGLEYGRYLQEVIKVLDEDPEFSKKLNNVTHDQIMNGHVARHIETVAPDVRNRLDELKRIELERLRKLAMKEHKLEEEMEHGAYEQEVDLESGRRWRTVGAASTNNKRKIPTKALLDNNNAPHLDHTNPHTFEAEDLQKLILQATKDLDELDRKRRRDFKQYEMEKEIHYRDSLKNMTDDQRKEAEKNHDELKKKHGEHPKVHHPGSKQQLEEVWEQQDNMPREEFDPKVFFQLHDVNGDGFLDQEEVEALLSIEVRKLYNEKDPSYDRNEMIEEYHRMREHIYKEIDLNRDGLISKKEFLDYTKHEEFQKDNGWKGIEEAPVYTEEELKHYEQQRQALQEHYAKYGAYQVPYQQGMEYGYQPVYYQVPHPAQQQAGYNPQQQQQHPVQYVQVNAPPEHIQQPVQYQHVQLPSQNFQQQQQHPQAQGQYHQPNPNIAQLPPAQQQQQQAFGSAPHPTQQYHPQQGIPQPNQQQHYQQGLPNNQPQHFQQNQPQHFQPGQAHQQPPQHQQAPLQQNRPNQPK